MPYWQREGTKRKGGKEIAEDHGLKLWEEFCQVRGCGSSQCFSQNHQWEKSDRLAHKDKGVGMF